MKIKETRSLRRWDLIALLVLLLGSLSWLLVREIGAAFTRDMVLMLCSLGILVLTGMIYYLLILRVRVTFKSDEIKLRMMPMGLVKRKIKWSDVESYEITAAPKRSRFENWLHTLSGFYDLIPDDGPVGLRLRLKNGEEVFIGCVEIDQVQGFLEKTERRM